MKNLKIDKKLENSDIIFTKEALHFVEKLITEFSDRRKKLLKYRKVVHDKINNGELPDFNKNTENIRKSNWKIADFPEEISQRTIEITGPPDAKMMINAFLTPFSFSRRLP